MTVKGEKQARDRKAEKSGLCTLIPLTHRDKKASRVTGKEKEETGKGCVYEPL